MRAVDTGAEGREEGGADRPAEARYGSDEDTESETERYGVNKQKWCNHGATSAQRAWTAGVSRAVSGSFMCTCAALRLRRSQLVPNLRASRALPITRRTVDIVDQKRYVDARRAYVRSMAYTALYAGPPARDAMARRWAMRRARAHAQQATPRGGTTARPAPGRGPWAPLRHPLTGLYHPLRHCAAIESNTATPAPSRGPSLSILVHVLLAAGGDGLALVHGVRLDGRARRDLHFVALPPTCTLCEPRLCRPPVLKIFSPLRQQALCPLEFFRHLVHLGKERRAVAVRCQVRAQVQGLRARVPQHV